MSGKYDVLEDQFDSLSLVLSSPQQQVIGSLIYEHFNASICVMVWFSRLRNNKDIEGFIYCNYFTNEQRMNCSMHTSYIQHLEMTSYTLVVTTRMIQT